MRIGLRSLLRAKGLTATVVVTPALGIGAKAAISSVFRCAGSPAHAADRHELVAASRS
jgi:hypothetical protein